MTPNGPSPSGTPPRRPWFSLRRVLAIARKEFIHLFRDPRTAPIVFAVPLIQLTLLGLTANFDVVDVPTVIVDQDHSPLSREVAGRVDAGEAFDVLEVTDSPSEGQRALEASEAQLVLVIPEGADEELRRGEAVSLPAWIDGTDTNRAVMARQYLDALLMETARERLPAGQQLPVGLPDPRTRVLYNPTLQSTWFMVPGVLVMVLTVLVTLLGALAIVKEREGGTIEQLAVTPIRSAELLVGKLAPFVLVGLLDGLLVMLVAVFGFHVPFRGSVAELTVMVLIYLFSTLGMGLMLSAISETQQQAMMSNMLILLPSILLGGIMYPRSSMPAWAQRISDLLPIRYFIVVVRGVLLKGLGLRELSHEVAAMALLGLLFLGVGIAGFRKRSA